MIFFRFLFADPLHYAGTIILMLLLTFCIITIIEAIKRPGGKK